ncbi:hypothetical protein ColTof3_04077 [Colletotrichum tofieldiae]|nr:hypothetical protein ColTof3_04077 [Colletotrichum tofieldiae]
MADGCLLCSVVYYYYYYYDYYYSPAESTGWGKIAQVHYTACFLSWNRGVLIGDSLRSRQHRGGAKPCL